MPQIRAIFDNIQHHLSIEIQGAKQYIRLAMAWLTDQNLYEQLCQMANAGAKVELLLLNDDINNNARNIDLERLMQTNNAEVVFMKPEDYRKMHNKYCIIDTHTVITGSYNWTYQAQQNDENIIIISNDLDIIADYVNNFNRLKQKYGGKISDKADLSILSKRLEMLRNALALADTDDILLQRNKTAQLLIEMPSEWLKIEECLHRNMHQEAETLIGNWLQHLIALARYQDYEFEELQFELKTLEVQLSALRDEKTDIETLISAFNRRYQLELGELILQIMELQTEQAEQAAKHAPENEKKQQAYEDLKNQFRQAYQEYAQEREKQTPDLNPEDENLLKTLYKKAVKLCHPDTVQDDALKAKAHHIFVELQAAYEAKDIEQVKMILDYLETGKPFAPTDNSKLQKDQLRARIAYLKQALQKLIQEIDQLLNSETYKTIIHIGNDWDAYFANAKQQLENQLHHLRKS